MGCFFYPWPLLKCEWKQNYKDIQIMMMVMAMTMICCLDWEVLSKHNMVHSKPITHLPWLDSNFQWQISLLVLWWGNRSQAFCIQLSALLLTCIAFVYFQYVKKHTKDSKTSRELVPYQTAHNVTAFIDYAEKMVKAADPDATPRFGF